MFKTSAQNLRKTFSLTTIAMMTALFVVLYNVKIPLALESRISLTFIPVAASAYLLGPVAAMIVGGFGDLLGCLFFPSGAYFPGFTLSAILGGVIYGICLYRCPSKQIILRVILAKVLIIVFVNIGLNTLWLSMMYGKAFFVLLTTRVVKNLILLPVQSIILLAVVKVLDRTGISQKYL